MGIASFAFAQTLAGKSFTRRKEQGAALPILLSGVSACFNVCLCVLSWPSFPVPKEYLARMSPKL